MAASSRSCPACRWSASPRSKPSGIIVLASTIPVPRRGDKHHHEAPPDIPQQQTDRQAAPGPEPVAGDSALDRALGLGAAVLGRISARVGILREALRLSEQPPGTPPDPQAYSGPLRALAAKIGDRCRQDPALCHRVALAVHRCDEAASCLESCHRGSVSPAELQARMAPLLRIHEAFGGDPLLSRLFVGSSPLPAVPADDRGAPVPAPLRPTREQASRALRLAEERIGSLRERMGLLEAALAVSKGEAPDHPPPVRELIRRLAALARDGAVERCLALAVDRFREASAAVAAGRARLDGTGSGTFAADGIRDAMNRLGDLPARFAGMPVLARMFPR